MLHHGSVDVDRDVEAGLSRADAGRESPAQTEKEGLRITKDFQPLSSGGQPPMLAPLLSRTPTQASKSSVVKARRQRKSTLRRGRSRSSSCATADGIAGLALAKHDLLKTTTWVQTGEQKHRVAAARPSQVTWGFFDMFFHLKQFWSRKKTEEDSGNVVLDTDRPGPWVVDHHIRSLIQEILPSPFERLQRQMLSSKGSQKPMSQADWRLDELGHPELTFRISFAEMQRMHLRKLQVGLVKHAVTMYTTKDESDKWEKDLAEYIQAMKDYDYMMECSKRPRDNFLTTGERNFDHYVTRRVIGKVLNGYASLDSVNKTHPVGPWEYDGRPIGGTRNSTTKAMSLQEFRNRLFLATAGAVLLLGTMWLMVLHETLYTSLITTTLCVAIFGLVVVVRLEKPMDVLSSTAAYTAVLVVFVGLTTGPT